MITAFAEKRKHGIWLVQTILDVLMDTAFLQTLRVVVEAGSFAEAARRLGVTPAAVAQRVHALETEIGASLVHRVGRTVQPTSAGVAVTSRISALLDEVRDLKVLASTEPAAGELRLGAVATAVTGLLPRALKRSSERYPRLEVYVVPGTSSDLYQSVLDGQLDAAIVVEPPFPIPKTCAWHVLRNEPLVVIAPRGVSLSDPHAVLRNEPVIRYDRNHWGGRLTESYLRAAGIRPKQRFELDALDAIAVLVDQHLGVALVPDWAPPWPAELRLQKARAPLKGFDRRIGLVWRQMSRRAKTIELLLRELRPRSGNIP
jgi:DNA-binding transcriptional LysR family regulator